MSLWKTIRKGWHQFAENVSYKLGDGALLSFWQDHWCGDTPLLVRFPELYRLASHPGASVQDLMILDGTSHHWMSVLLVWFMTGSWNPLLIFWM